MGRILVAQTRVQAKRIGKNLRVVRLVVESDH